jgi:hypothetical protein
MAEEIYGKQLAERAAETAKASADDLAASADTKIVAGAGDAAGKIASDAGAAPAAKATAHGKPAAAPKSTAKAKAAAKPASKAAAKGKVKTTLIDKSPLTDEDEFDKFFDDFLNLPPAPVGIAADHPMPAANGGSSSSAAGPVEAFVSGPTSAAASIISLPSGQTVHWGFHAPSSASSYLASEFGLTTEGTHLTVDKTPTPRVFKEPMMIVPYKHKKDKKDKKDGKTK